MREDFTELQNIDKPHQITMISGPISYSKFKIFNNNVQLKEIEIFGDEHQSEKNNCTDQGELCIYVTKHGIVIDDEDVKCVDIPTYLGYAILDAHKNKQYTDIYIEIPQQESGRKYDIQTTDVAWSVGYMIKTSSFLKPCGTSVNRHPLCRDKDLASSRDKIKEDSTSHSTRVSPNIERNWARVHSNDVRGEDMYKDLTFLIVDSLRFSKYRPSEMGRIIEVLNYLQKVKRKLLRAFLEEDLGSAIKQVFEPFYEMVQPSKSRNIQEQYVKKYYPSIHIIMREFGAYNDEQSDTLSITKRAPKGTLLLERTNLEGKTILQHRVGKTYAKVMEIKHQYEKHELPYIMIIAYEKFVSDIEVEIETYIKRIIEGIENLADIKPANLDDHINELNMYVKIVIIILLSPLYDIYNIGRLISSGRLLLNEVQLSYPESERILHFTGYAHAKKLRIYILRYLTPELRKANTLYDVNYSVIKEIDIPYNTEKTDRCMRL